MIVRTFYDEEDYKITLMCLKGVHVDEKDRERVFTRQMFLEGLK